MKRVAAWVAAAALALKLRALEYQSGGWVVMAECDDDSDWHAMAGGGRFGMIYDTGRFPTREQARAFAEYRNADPHVRYYVTHETVLNRPLPPNY